jgi:hypothetical protein
MAVSFTSERLTLKRIVVVIEREFGVSYHVLAGAASQSAWLQRSAKRTRSVPH